MVNPPNPSLPHCWTHRGYTVLEYPCLDSTNARAEKLLHPETADKTVVLTYCQQNGKGQAGNRWESEPGKNLSLSVIFRPHRLPADRPFALSMVTALGVSDFLSAYLPECRIKWPNDLYAGDGKIAGILIENTLQGHLIHSSVCGIGVNINQTRFLSDAPNPVSLAQLTGREYPLKEMVQELLDAIDKWYTRLTDYRKLETIYRARLYRREGVHRWQDADGLFRARIAGIDPFGRLILEDDNHRLRTYAFKEVTYL